MSGSILSGDHAESRSTHEHAAPASRLGRRLVSMCSLRKGEQQSNTQGRSTYAAPTQAAVATIER